MINALPSSISDEIEELKDVISRWPISFSIDHAIKWILQFDSGDYALALRILKNIDILAQKDVRSAFEVAQAKLERAAIEKGTPIKGGNTLYAGVGQSSKSGAVMAYHYRLTAQIAENDFFNQDEEDEIDFGRIDNIILLDDVIGTGKSVTTDVARIAEEVHSLSKSRSIYVLTVAGYVEGIGNVIKDTGASVISALEYSARDTVVDLDSPFYEGLPMSERTRTLDRIRRYCRIASRSDLGYGGVGGLLVFDHNTPNTTLPVIWAQGNGWVPLFPRAGRVQGTAKVLKAVEKERLADAAKSTPVATVKPERGAVNLTIFVEGKYDEFFVDVLKNRIALAERLGVKDVSAVALGGLAEESRLFELLRESRKYSVFVLDNDRFSRRLANRLEPNANTKVIYLKPTFAAMLDPKKIFSGDYGFRRLPDPHGDPSDEEWLEQLDRSVLKERIRSGNGETAAQVIEECLDPERYEEFIQNLNECINQLLA